MSKPKGFIWILLSIVILMASALGYVAYSRNSTAFQNLLQKPSTLQTLPNLNLKTLRNKLTPEIRACILGKLGRVKARQLLEEARQTKEIPPEDLSVIKSCIPSDLTEEVFPTQATNSSSTDTTTIPQSLLDEFSKASIPPAPKSSLISSITLNGDSNGHPITIANSDGDLWFSTWATDDNLYVTWGDGNGFGNVLSDIGVAQLNGNVPALTGKNVYNEVHPTNLADNDKPSSLLYLNGRLYGHFFSPLAFPRIGYNAYSDDYGKTWIRAGFYKKGQSLPQNPSPWTADVNSQFRSLAFINMGQSYQLNKDQYVYGFGLPQPGWHGCIYLTRVKKEEILNYSSYEYFQGMNTNLPVWSKSQADAKPLPGLVTQGQVSSMYHSGIGRYLLLTSQDLFEAPEPWGPWSYAGSWARPAKPGWAGGYQPGIITKNTGSDYFWFTISGQDKKGAEVTYKLNLGKIVLEINNQKE